MCIVVYVCGDGVVCVYSGVRVWGGSGVCVWGGGGMSMSEEMGGGYALTWISKLVLDPLTSSIAPTQYRQRT